MRKRRRQKDFQRIVSLRHLSGQKREGPEESWKEEKEREQSQGKEAWLWVGPLEVRPVCKKDKIKSAGQLQMHFKKHKNTH